MTRRQPLALLATLGALLCGIAVHDAPGAEAAVYWSSDSWVGAANVDGSESLISYPYEIVNVVPRSSVCGVAVDAAHLYWADSRQGTIGRMDLSPAAHGYLDYITDEPVAIDEAFVSGLVEPCWVAVDAGHIYWADHGAKTIGRSRLDGSGIERGLIRTGPGPCGVGVDSAHLYWTDTATGTVGRARLDGGEVEPEFVTGAGRPCGVAVDASRIYWSDEEVGIGRAGIDGSGAEPGFIPVSGRPCGVAVDTGHIYWGIRSERGSLVGRADLDGSDARVLVSEGSYGGGCGVALDSRVFGPDTSAWPSEYLRFGRIAHSRRNASMRFRVRVPDAGELLVTGPRIGWRVAKPAADAATRGPRVWKLKLWPGRGTPAAKRIRRQLRRTGRSQIVLAVAYRQQGRQPLTVKKRVFFRSGKAARLKRSVARHGHRSVRG